MSQKKFNKIRQEEIVKFIRSYYKKYNFSPTLAEIGKGLGLSSQRICQLIGIMVKDKKIKRSKWKQRNLILIEKKSK